MKFEQVKDKLIVIQINQKILNPKRFTIKKNPHDTNAIIYENQKILESNLFVFRCWSGLSNLHFSTPVLRSTSSHHLRPTNNLPEIFFIYQKSNELNNSTVMNVMT